MNQVLEQKMQEYFDSIYVMSHSYSTVSSYRLSITNKNKRGFREFLQEKFNFDELELVQQVKTEKLDVYAVLRDFVIFLDKSGYKPNSIKTRLAAIKGYLRFLGIKIYTEDCKHIIKTPKNIREPEVALTKELISRVLRNVPQRLQTVILVLASSGIRIGELVQLQYSDIDFSTTPTAVNLPARITKTKQPRQTFMSSEATKATKDYLTRFLNWNENDDNSNLDKILIFARGFQSKNKKIRNSKQPAHLNAEGILMHQLKYYIDKIPDLSQTNPNGIRVIRFHALRKFFRTTVGNALGRDFAEALIGHQFYMNTYYQLSDEKKREMYLEVEPLLTISDLISVENNLKQMNEKYQNLESKLQNLSDYLKNNSIKVPNL